MEEFHLDCRVSKPLCARILVLPTDGGWLLRGTLEGEVVLPCSRCAEDSIVTIAARFEDFESLPGGSDDEDEEENYAPLPDMDGVTEGRIVFERNAPMRIIEAVGSRLELTGDRVFTNVEKYGNTSSASIPLALTEARAQGRIRPGSRVLMTAFGAGLTWGAALLRF